jgi:glyoxylase-like metal-dependent hydrolase (beta-lactamase superfamily II)
MHESELKIYQNLSLQSRMFGYSTGEPWPNIQFLKDQAEIQFGNSHVLQVLHTPGHSPGSLGFHSKEGRFLIAGDVLFKGSIGRTDLWEGDFKTLIHSIQNRILSLPPDTRIFPGHGPDTTVGIEKNSNPFLNQ